MMLFKGVPDFRGKNIKQVTYYQNWWRHVSKQDRDKGGWCFCWSFGVCLLVGLFFSCLICFCALLSYSEFRDQIPKNNAICGQRSVSQGPGKIYFKKMIHSLLTAVHLKRDEFCKGAQTKTAECKDRPIFTRGLMRHILFYLMLNLYNSNCSERMAIAHWVEVVTKSQYAVNFLTNRRCVTNSLHLSFIWSIFFLSLQKHNKTINKLLKSFKYS